MKRKTSRRALTKKGARAKRVTERAGPTSPVLDAGMARALGIRLISVAKKKVVAEMPIGTIHLNRTGRVAGGAIMAFADVLGAVGAVMNRPPGHRGGTVESKTNFFASGTGPVLSAVSVPLHVGRTTSVWQTSVKNRDGKLVAVVTQTQIALPRNLSEAEGRQTPKGKGSANRE